MYFSNIFLNLLAYIIKKMVLDLPQWTFLSVLVCASRSICPSVIHQCLLRTLLCVSVLFKPLSVSPPLQSEGGRADASQPGVGLHQVLLLLPHRRLHLAGDGHWRAATVSPFRFVFCFFLLIKPSRPLSSSSATSLRCTWRHMKIIHNLRPRYGGVCRLALTGAGRFCRMSCSFCGNCSPHPAVSWCISNLPISSLAQCI